MAQLWIEHAGASGLPLARLKDDGESALKATANPAFDLLAPDPATAAAPHRVFNIGNSQPTPLLRFIEVMEEALGREAIKDFQPMQPGDVVAIAANTAALEEWVGFKPSTPIETGVQRFAEWYRSFYGV